ncbi:MAG: tetratricopeptide repeat protein, partial [Cyclobacteriaceae bacterium]
NRFEPNIYNTLAMIAIEQKETDLALELIDKALSLAPAEPYFINNKGYVFLIQRKLDEAAKYIDASLSADPENGWAYRNKGIYYLLKEDYSNAERLLSQAVEMDSFIDKIHFYLGMAYLKNGKKAQACEQFDLSEEAGDAMLTTDLLKLCK